MTSLLDDKRDDFSFPIVSFPFISRNIPAPYEFTTHTLIMQSTVIFFTAAV